MKTRTFGFSVVVGVSILFIILIRLKFLILIFPISRVRAFDRPVLSSKVLCGDREV